MNALQLCLLASLCMCSHSLPPDKMKPFHIIKTRSIDLNNAHGLVMETRLEKSVEPTGYRLELEPYLEDALYKGHVSINVTWLEDSSTISVHCAHEIDITESEVKAYMPSDAKKPQKIPIRKTSMDPRKPIFTLRLEKPVPKSSVGFINFSFKASMQTADTEAFFKTTYVTEDVERMVAATQLRPNNARRMFPCFDEPGYKTPFELSVVRPRTMIALSNTPVARTEDINGEPNAVWDHFERTPPMSTFTLGLIIADLKQLGESTHYKDENGNDIELRVWGRPEYLQALEGVNERLARVFSEVAKFWQVPLPLRRLDIVALPNYQGVKPADNWGLIAYKESDLSNNKYWPLAQELSYQWLGALATPAWWSDAHLNKALVGYLVANLAFKLDGGSEMDGKWPTTMLYSMYYELSKRYPHSRITGMKQETTCFKIELLFRMFNYTIGEDTFKKGIRTFIESKKFKTFTGDDIWNALTEAALADGKIPKDVDFKTVATSWIDKDRLPLVTVKRNTDANSALITQRHLQHVFRELIVEADIVKDNCEELSGMQKVYLRDRPHDVPDTAKLLWWAPIVLWRSDNMDFTSTKPIAWMRNHKELNLVNMPDKEYFIIVNPEEIAPFPVNYDVENWKLISEFLQSKDSTKIPEQTRAKLLHDAWNLAYAGELSFDTALNMTLFLPKEKNPLVWDPLFIMIDHVGRHICSCLQDKFRAYVRNIITPVYNKLTKEKTANEDTGKKSLRTHARSVLCSAGHKPCVREAQEVFSKWMQSPNPDEGNPVPDYCLCPVFQWGTQKEWDFALQRVINFPPSRTKSERTYLLKTLAGCPKDEYKIEKILNITLLEENGNFTEKDLFLIFSMLTGSPEGYTTLFNYLSNNWEVLKEKYSSRTNLWDSLISCATSQFTTQDGYDLVSNFYAAHKGEFGSARHIIEKSMKNILEEAKWSSENLPVLERWLDNYLQTTEMEEDQYEKN